MDRAQTHEAGRAAIRAAEADVAGAAAARRELVEVSLALVLHQRMAPAVRSGLRRRLADCLPALIAMVDHPLYGLRMRAETAVAAWETEPLAVWPLQAMGEALGVYFTARALVDDPARVVE
jgi:hypothetical protein